MTSLLKKLAIFAIWVGIVLSATMVFGHFIGLPIEGRVLAALLGVGVVAYQESQKTPNNEVIEEGVD